MNNFTAWTATRTDRGPSAAHRGTALAPASDIATKQLTGSPMVAFVAPTYVVDQESHPPRDRIAG